MNIYEFRQQVQKRIVSHFLATVKRQKMGWWHVRLIAGAIFFPPFLVYSFIHIHDPGLLFLGPFILSIPCLVFPVVTILNWRAFLNFKKESDNYFKSPPLETNEELLNYLYRSYLFFAKGLFGEHQIKECYQFTQEELIDFEKVILTQQQKDYILNKIKNGGIFNFDILQELILVEQENESQIKNEFNNKINELGISHLLEKPQLAQKLKEML